MKKILTFLTILMIGFTSFAQIGCTTSFYTEYRYTFDDKGKAVEDDYKAKYKARVDINKCDSTVMVSSKKMGRDKVTYDSLDIVVVKYRDYHHFTYFYKGNVVATITYDLDGNITLIRYDSDGKKMYMHVED